MNEDECNRCTSLEELAEMDVCDRIMTLEGMTEEDVINQVLAWGKRERAHGTIIDVWETIAVHLAHRLEWKGG